MTVLNFPAAARATEPVDLTRALMHLSDLGAQARIASSATADLLREAFAEYWADAKSRPAPQIPPTPSQPPSTASRKIGRLTGCG